MNDLPAVLSVPKTSRSHADVFAAAGLADLLAGAVGGSQIRIIEEPDRFLVRLLRPLQGDELTTLPLSAGYEYLQTSPKVAVPTGVTQVVNYAAEKERVARYRALLESIRKDKTRANDPAIQEALGRDRPRDDWRLLQVLNTLQGDPNTNRVHELLSNRPEEMQRHVVERLLLLADGRLSALEWKEWKEWKATSVQLFSPGAAKGYARLKPDSTDRNDKTKDAWTDPFLEWLRYRGYFRVACPYFQGSNSEHIRLLCPIPTDISPSALADVASALRRARVYGQSTKLDSLAVLELAEILIRGSEEFAVPGAKRFAGVLLAGRTPARVISGVYVTHYQSLGNARAVSSMFSLALPGWFSINSRGDAELWLAILDEHRRVVRSLQDDHSDEIGLLLQYRRFLERRARPALEALLDFMGAYGPFLIRAREQKRRVPAFRTDHLRRIIVSITPDYSAILGDDGFRAIAAAVRRSTVSAQARKAMGHRDYREIRYGLLPELRRKRSLQDNRLFLETVCEFVASYNVENARRRETGRPAPANITTEELARFVALVEGRGAPLVGALLCAYGSCREPGEADKFAPDEGQDLPSRDAEVLVDVTPAENKEE